MDLTTYLMSQNRGLVNSHIKQKKISRMKHGVTKIQKNRGDGVCNMEATRRKSYICNQSPKKRKGDMGQIQYWKG